MEQKSLGVVWNTREVWKSWGGGGGGGWDVEYLGGMEVSIELAACLLQWMTHEV